MTIYTWDDAKRKSNLRTHGLDFADAHFVFEGSSYTVEDTRYRYGERRYNTYGYLYTDLVRVTYTERHYGIRIISFRKASKRETLRLFGRF